MPTNKKITSKVCMDIRTFIGEFEKAQPDSPFFSQNNLKWFGEKLSNMKVLEETREYDGHTCYVVSSFQSKAPSGMKNALHYFDVETFEPIKTRWNKVE